MKAGRLVDAKGLIVVCSASLICGCVSLVPPVYKMYGGPPLARSEVALLYPKSDGAFLIYVTGLNDITWKNTGTYSGNNCLEHPIELQPGKHVVTAQVWGGQTATLPFEAKPGHSYMIINAAPATATYVVPEIEDVTDRGVRPSPKYRFDRGGPRYMELRQDKWQEYRNP